MYCSDDQIHVLHTVNTLGMGGAEQYVIRLSRALADMGIRVTVAAASATSPLRKSLGSDVEYLDLPLIPTDGVLLRHFGNGVRVPHVLSRYIENESVHLVHTYLVASGLWAWVAAHRAGVPVVHTQMHVYENAGPYERLVFRIGELKSLVSVFHGLSDYLSGQLRSEFGVPDDRVRTITSGIDTTLFAPADQSSARRIAGIPQGRFVVGLCSRLRPEKRLDLAIRAHAVLMDTVPDALLVIAGGGSEASNLVSLADDLGIRGSVMFLGEVSQVNQLLPAFDVYLQTTKGPNLGFSALEALACAKPVVIAADSEREMAMGQDTLCGAECGAVVEAS